MLSKLIIIHSNKSQYCPHRAIIIVCVGSSDCHPLSNLDSLISKIAKLELYALNCCQSYLDFNFECNLKFYYHLSKIMTWSQLKSSRLNQIIIIFCEQGNPL